MKKILGIGVMFIALAVHTSGFAQRTTFQLINGEDSTGLWLSVQTWQGSQLRTEPAVRQALEVNGQIIAYDDASQLKQSQVAKPLNALDLQRTPALLPIDANQVEYNRVWKWGNDVLLDVRYLLPTRTIPWRTDYRCGAGQCQLLVEPKDQFFELSYYLYKNQSTSAVPENALIARPAGMSQYVVNWPAPTDVPIFTASTIATDAAVWYLNIASIDTELRWNNKTEQFVASKAKESNPLAQKLLAKINQRLAAAKLEQAIATETTDEPDEYRTPIEKRGFGYFKRNLSDGSGIQTAQRLVYHEQIYNMLQSWRSITLIGTLQLGDKNFLFIQPTLKADDNNKLEQPGAVTVFESAVNGELELGVSADWVGALLSSNQLLESIRRGQPVKQITTNSAP